MKDKTTWIFENKDTTKRRKNYLLNRICAILNENDDDPTWTRFDLMEGENLYLYTIRELEELVVDIEDHYRKPLRIVK